MKKFKFRLDTLIKVRQMKKEQAEINFAAATTKYLCEKRKFEDLETRQRDCMASFNISQNELVCIERIRNHHDYLNKLKKELSMQKECVHMAEQEQKESLIALDAAMKEMKIIEELRTKRFEQFKMEALRNEQQYLDDLGIQVYVRQVR